MMEVLSDQEWEDMKQENWDFAKPLMLCEIAVGLSDSNKYIIIEKNEDSLTLLELSPSNIQRLLNQEPYETVTFSYDDIEMINLISTRETPEKGLEDLTPPPRPA